MRIEATVLEQLESWAKESDNVRALIMTSSRTNPHAEPDMFSDYDIEVYVKDTSPFLENDDWLDNFGPVMVQWPLKPGPTFSPDWVTQLVQFEDGVRIDFQITAKMPGDSENLDYGFKVIVDKDGICANLPAPSYACNKIERPTAEAFDARANAFWWDIIYVAKALRREELNYAKYMLDSTIRFDKLLPVLKWHIGLHHDWSGNTGLYGRWLHRFLDKKTWEDYQKTFAGPDIEDNWRALFVTLDLFRKIAKELAKNLGFNYPEDTDVKVTEYISLVIRTSA